MRTRIFKDLTFAETEGIWIRIKGKYSSFSIKVWDRLFNQGRLEKIGDNRWKLV